MFHVQKHDWYGCGVATAAMTAELTYEEAANRCGELEPGALRDPHRLRRTLVNLTGCAWMGVEPFRPPLLSELPLPDHFVAVLLQDDQERPRYSQWVVLKGSLVHDPQYATAHVLAHYPRRSWFVNCLLEPAQPERLSDLRANRIDAVLRELAAELTVGTSP